MTSIVRVSVANEACFFHVFGDSTKYYDMDSLLTKHPEMDIAARKCDPTDDSINMEGNGSNG